MSCGVVTTSDFEKLRWVEHRIEFRNRRSAIAKPYRLAYENVENSVELHPYSSECVFDPKPNAVDFDIEDWFESMVLKYPWHQDNPNWELMKYANPDLYEKEIDETLALIYSKRKREEIEEEEVPSFKDSKEFDSHMTGVCTAFVRYDPTLTNEENKERIESLKAQLNITIWDDLECDAEDEDEWYNFIEANTEKLEEIYPGFQNLASWLMYA